MKNRHSSNTSLMCTRNLGNRTFQLSTHRYHQPAYNSPLDRLPRQAGYEFLGLYLRSLPSTSSAAQEAAVRLIATALRLPAVFDFDPLFKLDAVIAVKDHELFSLLQIYLNDGLLEFNAWEASHPGAFEKYGKLKYPSYGLSFNVSIDRSRQKRT